MTTTDEIVAKAMQLSEKERASVAHQLLLSLDSEDVDEDDIASAWQEEIETRLQKIADGKHHTQNWREALAEVRRDLKRDVKP
jgi:hypothetical protein